MNDSIVLDKPDQITMWVLLSRRAQVKMHLAGFKVKGILGALRRDIPGCENIRRVVDAVVPIEFAISKAGGKVDYRLVNVHVMERTSNNLFQDLGVYSNTDEVHENAYAFALYMANRLELVLTLDDPRPANGELYTGA